MIPASDSQAPLPPADLAGRVALVTGAARGIGLSIASALANQGAGVALVDVDAPALQAAASSISSRALALQADVSSLPDVERAVASTVGTLGSLDILVNNAGICPLTPFADIAESEWDRVLAINLKGAFFCCQVALPHLVASRDRGRIINVSSVGGQMGGVAIGVHYSASKAGLLGLSKSLARLLATDGVTVNCIAPGTTDTDLTASWSGETKSAIKAKIPLGRFAQSEEIAAAVCFLASDQAAYITGATIDVSGGLYMR